MQQLHSAVSIEIELLLALVYYTAMFSLFCCLAGGKCRFCSAASPGPVRYIPHEQLVETRKSAIETAGSRHVSGMITCHPLQASKCPGCSLLLSADTVRVGFGLSQAEGEPSRERGCVSSLTRSEAVKSGRACQSGEAFALHSLVLCFAQRWRLGSAIVQGHWHEPSATWSPPGIFMPRCSCVSFRTSKSAKESNFSPLERLIMAQLTSVEQVFLHHATAIFIIYETKMKTHAMIVLDRSECGNQPELRFSFESSFRDTVDLSCT